MLVVEVDKFLLQQTPLVLKVSVLLASRANRCFLLFDLFQFDLDLSDLLLYRIQQLARCHGPLTSRLVKELASHFCILPGSVGLVGLRRVGWAGRGLGHGIILIWYEEWKL